MSWFSSILKKITGGDAGSRVLNDADKKMIDMAKATFKDIETENDKFYQEVLYSNLESNRVIPVNAVLYRKNFVKVITTVDSQSLMKQGVGDLIGNVANSNISGAIGGVLQTAVAALLGNNSMSYKKKIGYSLSVGKLGGVERVDFMFAARSTTSKSFTTKMENIISGVFVVSSCDVEKLTPNDATVLVQNCFKTEPLTVQAYIKQLLMVSLDARYSQKKKRELQRPIIAELTRFYEEMEKPKRAGLLPPPQEEEKEEEELAPKNSRNEIPEIKSLPQAHPEEVTVALGLLLFILTYLNVFS